MIFFFKVCYQEKKCLSHCYMLDTDNKYVVFSSFYYFLALVYCNWLVFVFHEYFFVFLQFS